MSTTWITALSAVIIALLGGGGIYALLKVRPEAAQISVSAAQGAVIVQTGVIESLREENRRLSSRLSEIERTSQSVDKLRQRIEALESERDTLREENRRLTRQIAQLRSEVEGRTNGGEGK